MRVWDVLPRQLCRQHLLGEHNEIHALWTILTQERKGYSSHPETLRWKGKLAALYNRHADIAKEMENRGYRHASMLDSQLATGEKTQTMLINTVEEQRAILRLKRCSCKMQVCCSFWLVLM